VSEEDLDQNYQEADLDYIEAIYDIYDADDNHLAIMIEFKSEEAIQELLDKEGLTKEETEGLFYKKLYIVSPFESSDEIQYLLDIIK